MDVYSFAKHRHQRIESNFGDGVSFDQAHGDLSLVDNTIQDNQRSGVYLVDFEPTFHGNYVVTGNQVHTNGGTGIYLDNWYSGKFDFSSNVIADNGTAGSGNFVTHGFGGAVYIQRNEFISHSGPALNAQYNYWGGDLINENAYTGPSASIFSIEGVIYGNRDFVRYQDKTGQDRQSRFNGVTASESPN